MLILIAMALAIWVPLLPVLHTAAQQQIVTLRLQAPVLDPALELELQPELAPMKLAETNLIIMISRPVLPMAAQRQTVVPRLQALVLDPASDPASALELELELELTKRAETDRIITMVRR